MASHIESTQPHSLNILVVDDFHFNRRVISGFLNDMNCQSVHASNGLEAVQLAEEQPFDLVLMDIRMPIMDGLRATRKIQQTQPGIPVVAITGDDSEREYQKAIDAGCNTCLTKPVQISILKKIIHQISR